MRLAFVTYRALPQLSDDDRLALTELRQHGVAVESAVWDSPLVDWSRYDAAVLRSTWDYHERSNEFEAWLAHLERIGVPVWNPPPLVRWNMDKRYLLDLSERGVPTVPTVSVDRGEGVTLADIAAETGWPDLVFKPSVSASGFRTTRAPAGSLDDHEAAFASLVADRDTLVQPFVPAIVDEGELSLVFLSGQYSHAVRKLARRGEFRVQSEFGGSVQSEVPRGSLVAAAEGVVANLPGQWLYARVDACEHQGQLLLMELELVDPELFLGFHVSAPRRFAAAIRQLVAGRRTPINFTPRSVTPPRGLDR